MIVLGKLGQLGLLLKLYSEILIPREVYNEVVVNGLRLGAPDARAVDFLIQQGHIRVADVTLPSPPPIWAQPIDIGELEVIVLAQQQSADWVLIDNAHARKAARLAMTPPTPCSSASVSLPAVVLNTLRATMRSATGIGKKSPT